MHDGRHLPTFAVACLIAAVLLSVCALPSMAASPKLFVHAGAGIRPPLDEIGARIRETAHRVRIAFAAACPDAALVRDIAITLRPAPA